MVGRIVLALFVVAALSMTASAAPFTVKASVNGADPASTTAVVKAGEAADVSVTIPAPSGNVEITGVEVDSEPAAIGAIVEAYIESRSSFPSKLEAMNDRGSYDLPGFVPAGDYSIKTKIRYGGDRIGTSEYNARIRVENEGILSMILGLLMKFIPKFVVKPIAGAIL